MISISIHLFPLELMSAFDGRQPFYHLMQMIRRTEKVPEVVNSKWPYPLKLTPVEPQMLVISGK